jgi:hypothetical protein
MGIDAVAVLKIMALPAPKTEVGTSHFVQHAGDATLLHTMERYDAAAPDEHALTLRRILGDALDRHHDDRGILFFPDVYEPRGRTYSAIVREVGGGGVWAPIVTLDHVPRRITAAAAGSIEELVAEAMRVMGPDGRRLVEVAQLVYPSKVTTGGAPIDPLHETEYRKAVAPLEAAMGAQFVRELETRCDALLERHMAAQRAFFGID